MSKDDMYINLGKTIGYNIPDMLSCILRKNKDLDMLYDDGGFFIFPIEKTTIK